MNRKRFLAAALLCLAIALAGTLHRASADATDEMKRLAALMDWKPGTIVADIGAGVPSMLGGAPTSSHGLDDGEE